MESFSEPIAPTGAERRFLVTVRNRVLVIIAILLSFSIGVVFASRIGPSAVVTTGSSPVEAGRGALSTHERSGIPLDTHLFRDIANRANPLVVFVTTRSRVRATDDNRFFDQDDFFRRFFGSPTPEPQEQIRRGLGSGFIIGKDGEVLTNNHVVADAEKIQVGLFDDTRRLYDAVVVGRDALSDSALIKLSDPPSDLPIAALGDSDALSPGDWVMAIGNPFQLGHTVTVGVVSYVGRPFQTTEGRWQKTIQTDASINPGNSGGPLINVSGEVVGINAAILGDRDGGGNIGIGFAVPINSVKSLLPELRKGKVVRGRMGVQVRTGAITEEEARTLHLPKAGGAIITGVEQDSPAERAGIQAGDVIVKYDGKPVADADQLVALVTGASPGTRAKVELYRGGQAQEVTVTIEELQLEDRGTAGADRKGGNGFGLSLGDVTPDISRQLRLPPATRGALVEDVSPGSPGADAGLRRGDVILEVNQREVYSVSDAERALQQARRGQVIFLLLQRQESRAFVEMRNE